MVYEQPYKFHEYAIIATIKSATTSIHADSHLNYDSLIHVCSFLYFCYFNFGYHVFG